MDNFTNYVESKRQGSYIGFVSLWFRDTNNPSFDLMGNSFILNSFNDTWFRCTEGNAKGYGLSITEFKVTGRTSLLMGNFNCYKVKVSYRDWYEEDLIREEFMWLAIHRDFEIEDVLGYINLHKDNWKP